VRPCKALFALLVAGAVAPDCCTEQPPQLILQAGVLRLQSLPPTLLSEATIARHLGTGLTTSFLFNVDAGRALKAQAQVRARYDLWDERYLIERWDARPDAPSRAALAPAALQAWWRSLSLDFGRSSTGSNPPTRATIELLVLPFSESEQRDAQDWLVRSLRKPEPVGGSLSAGSLHGISAALLAASIGQRSLITYSWTVPITVESP